MRVCKKFFSTLMSWSNETVDESLQTRVWMRVFLTLVSWLNENTSCMRVDAS